jgi:hypothetical protein
MNFHNILVDGKRRFATFLGSWRTIGIKGDVEKKYFFVDENTGRCKLFFPLMAESSWGTIFEGTKLDRALKARPRIGWPKREYAF